MDEQEIARIRGEFDRFDKDDNSRVDLQEFTRLLAVLSPKTDPGYIERGFTLVGDNNDGLIDIDGFLERWQEAEWET